MSLFVSLLSAGANKKMDDDGIMVSIYDEVTSELKVTKESMLEKQKEVSVLVPCHKH